MVSDGVTGRRATVTGKRIAITYAEVYTFFVPDSRLPHSRRLPHLPHSVASSQAGSALKKMAKRAMPPRLAAKK
jgi:hypothetical protein